MLQPASEPVNLCPVHREIPAAIRGEAASSGVSKDTDFARNIVGLCKPAAPVRRGLLGSYLLFKYSLSRQYYLTQEIQFSKPWILLKCFSIISAQLETEVTNRMMQTSDDGNKSAGREVQRGSL